LGRRRRKQMMVRKRKRRRTLYVKRRRVEITEEKSVKKKGAVRFQLNWRENLVCIVCGQQGTDFLSRHVRA